MEILGFDLAGVRPGPRELKTHYEMERPKPKMPRKSLLNTAFPRVCAIELRRAPGERNSLGNVARSRPACGELPLSDAMTPVASSARIE